MENSPSVSGSMQQTGAGFGIRLIAFILDAVLISAISYLIFGDKIVTSTATSFEIKFNGIYSLIPVAYQLICWFLMSGSPGKWIAGLKIMNQQGKRMTPAEVVLRTLGYIISGVVLLLGFIWIIFDARKQGWHDKIAKTFVVKR